MSFYYCCSCYLMIVQEPVFSVHVSVNKSVFAGRAMYCNVAMQQLNVTQMSRRVESLS